MGEPIATVGDLAGICGHDGTDWLKIAVDANGYLKVIGGGVAGAIEVTQDTPGDLLMGQHQYDGAAWRKSNLIFGYHDRYAESESETSDGSTPTTCNLTAVPEGEVWVIQHAGMHFNDTANRSCFIETVCGAVVVPLNADANLASLVRMFWQGQMVMKEGDYIRARVNNLTDTKPMYCYAQGYKMDIEM